MNLDKRISKLESKTNENPDAASVVVYKHDCGTPSDGDGPPCRQCGQRLTIVRGNVNASTLFLLPDNGRDAL